jgi:hypothetical protein
MKDEDVTDEIISSPVCERQNGAQPDLNLHEEFPCTLQTSHLDKCHTDLADCSVTSSIATPSTFDQGLKVKQ